MWNLRQKNILGLSEKAQAEPSTTNMALDFKTNALISTLRQGKLVHIK